MSLNERHSFTKQTWHPPFSFVNKVVLPLWWMKMKHGTFRAQHNSIQHCKSQNQKFNWPVCVLRNSQEIDGKWVVRPSCFNLTVTLNCITFEYNFYLKSWKWKMREKHYYRIMWIIKIFINLYIYLSQSYVALHVGKIYLWMWNYV